MSSHSCVQLNNRQTARFCQQLSTLLTSGLPLADALRVIGQTPFFKKERLAIGRMIERIEEGASLGEGAKQVLPDLACATLQAADRGGAVEKVLNYLGNYYDQRAELSEKLIGALVYPAFVAVVSLGLLVFLLVYVVPSMSQLLEEVGSGLPPLTVAVMAISSFLVNYWLLIVGGVILLGVVALKRRNAFMSGLTRLPLLGDYYRQELALFNCLTFGMLLEGGISLSTAMAIGSRTVTDPLFQADLNRLRTEVENGRKISEALAESRYFPTDSVSLVAIGENTGRLGAAFLDVAAFKAKERGARLEQLSKLLEPAITATVGGLVAFIVLALFLPLLKLVAALS
ncbi:MAG: type II secretion system F family protein [Candidatus Margulisiibacteriota bacterium]|jgi:type II secretory pathway component PulF